MKYSSIVFLATALVSVVVSAEGLTCYSCMGYDSSKAEDSMTNNKHCDVASFQSSDVKTAEKNKNAFCYTVSTVASQVNNGDPFTARGVYERNKTDEFNDFLDNKLRENRLSIVICDADLCNSAPQLFSQGMLTFVLLPSLLYKLLG